MANDTLPDSGSENDDQTFTLSDADLDTICRDVSHSLPTALGEYLYPLYLACEKLGKHETFAEAIELLQVADKKMTGHAGEKLSQPALAPIFDDPLSIVRHYPDSSPLARLLADPTHAEAVAAAVAPFIRTLNEQVEPAFRILQGLHQIAMDWARPYTVPASLDDAVSHLVGEARQFDEKVSTVMKTWLDGMRESRGKPVEDLLTDLRNRAAGSLQKIS